MAELNFPVNPQIGDEYVFGNLLYKYDGEKWTTWGSGANTALDLRNELAANTGASMIGTASGNTVQEELDMAGSGLSLEPLRRSYAEAGFDMDISESFALGGTLNAANEVLLGEGLIGYSWGGTFPKEVPPNSTPLDTGGIGSAGWIDQSHNTLRAQAKTYVDNADAGLQGQINNKSDVSHTHTAAEIGAVSKAGDTMTGRLIVDVDNDAIHLSASASTASFIHSQVDGVNNWYVGKGSASNDNITLESYVHGTSLDLLSTSVEVNKIFKAKSGEAQAIELWGTDHVYLSGFDSSGARQWYVGKGSSTAAGVSIWDGINDTYMALYSDQVVFSRDPRTLAAQGTGANSLTRRDYVDAALLVKADVDRVNTLEATITALLARIEVLESINNTPTA